MNEPRPARRHAALLGALAGIACMTGLACASSGTGASSDAGFEVSRAGTELPDSLQIEHDEPPRLVNGPDVERVIQTEYRNWLAEEERMRQRVGATPMPWRGRVTLHIYITSAGETVDVRLIQATGRREVDRAAVQAATTMRWIPAKKDGRPIAIWFVQSFRF